MKTQAELRSLPAIIPPLRTGLPNILNPQFREGSTKIPQHTFTIFRNSAIIIAHSLSKKGQR